MSLKPIHQLQCIHCNEPIALVFYNEEKDPIHERPFCCQGCLTVYEVLTAKGLDEYYDIKNAAGVYRRRSPVELQETKYQYLESKEFLEEYSYINGQKLRTMEFYLEGIHCLACLWLIEKLPHLVEHVLHVKLDMEKSIAMISIDEHGKFSKAAQELNILGYRPHPLKKNQDVFDFKQKEERQFLLRIGVAGAGASNAMLYAISIYAGADTSFVTLFNILTVAFAIPVLSFSAFPFYKNAWQSLKNRALSIDIPIAISLCIGIVFGFYNLAIGKHENYFDSLSSLVFLLLISRYFLKKIQEKALSAKDLHFFYQSESVLRKIKDKTDQFEEIHPKYVEVDDILKIKRGDFFPADGIVLEGRSHANLSLLTGESRPTLIQQSDQIFSGTQNISNELLIQVKKIKENTKLGEILRAVESGWSQRAPVVDLTDKISRYFILAVCILSAIVFCKFALSNQLQIGLTQAITLLIITCPCALALAVPLSFTRALNLASDHGMIIKNDAVLQKLSEIKNIFFDKTGTLTFGKLSVENVAVSGDVQLNLPLADIIYTLEEGSKHPVGLALASWAKIQGGVKQTIVDFCEIPGVGVEGFINNIKYSIDKDGLKRDKALIVTFYLSDVIRPDTMEAVTKLKNMYLNPTILTGDNEQNANHVASLIGLTTDDVRAGHSPEEKSQVIKNSRFPMMIGDGANDAIAFSFAHVGVAVLGSMDMALRAADVYLAVPGISSIEKLIILGRETMKVIKRNLILSLLYNLVSVVFAFLGLINPLLAAIIMPISSLTVTLSTLYGTKKLRTLWK